MKKKYLMILGLISLISLQSCDDFLDINKTPNATTESTVGLVLPAAEASIAYIMGGQYQVLGGIFAQHWTSQKGGPQYTQIDNYNITVDAFNRPWTELYSGGINDLEWIRKKSKEEKNWKYYLIATALQCYTYQILADLHDQIPFNEACQATDPHFEEGSLVYDGLIARLNEALEYDLTSSQGDVPKENDLVFSGNMESWVKFANTLKLKIFMRQVYARPDVAQQGIAEMLSKGVKFLDVNASFKGYESSVGKMNPFYATEVQRFQGINLGASATLLSTNVINNDPRTNEWFNLPSGSSVHVGMVQGYGVSLQSSPENISTPKILSTSDVFLMTAAESYFLLAEAAARGFGGSDVNLYLSGIQADFSRLGLTYTNSIYEYPISGDFEAKLSAIMYQKWLSMVNIQGIEAFLEHNRTHYPDIYTVPTFSVLPAGAYPKRLWIPETEITNNSFHPSQPAGITVKVWWDKK